MNEKPKLAPLSAELIVTKWDDSLIERAGHPILGSAYFEQFWLPVLGPSTSWLARRLVMLTTAAEDIGPNRTLVDTLALSQSLGLGAGIGAHAALTRSVHRLERFGVGQLRGDTLKIRTHLDRVPAALRSQWPTFLQTEHQAVTAQLTGSPS